MADVVLTAYQHERIRSALARADAARPATVADQHTHYCALIELKAVLQLHLDDATAALRDPPSVAGTEEGS